MSGHWLLIVLFLAFFRLAFGVGETGNIKGKVVDDVSGNPLSGVKVEIAESGLAVITDDGGFFIFQNISFGKYTIRFSVEGFIYETLRFVLDSTTSDKELPVRLNPFEPVLDTIDVHASYFKKDPKVNTSYNYAVYEELRMTPGASEDIVKYFQSSPGVTTANDMENDIITRGGSPIENLTLIDGIEVQNPNHYGPPGSTSGALSYINLKMVQEADFYSGGYPVKYGDKLSSVMDIKFREGSRDKHYQYLNLSVTGFGAFVEGPLDSRSSYMLGVRRSYLELIKEQLNSPLIPNYWDVNLKLNYHFSRNEKLSLVGIGALDRAEPYEPGGWQNVDLSLTNFGLSFSRNTTHSTLDVILSHSYDYYNVVYDFFRLDIKQHRVDLKIDYDEKVSDDLKVNLFYGNRFYLGKYNVYAHQFISHTGYYLQNIGFNAGLSTFKIFGGFNLTADLLNGKLSCNLGLRADYFDFLTRGLCISPRAGMSYKLNKKTFLNLNAGYFYQSPEFLWLLADRDNRNLSYLHSKHAVLGIEHFIFDDLRLNLESYIKYYTDNPVNVYDPFFLYIGGGTGLEPEFLGKAVSKGKGYFAGIDFTIQKKSTGAGFFGYLTYSFTRSKFYALAGGAQPGSFDFGNQCVVVAGWKLKSLWAFSVRARYSGGMPSTPFDSVQSRYLYQGVYDISQYQRERVPYYLRFDSRIEKEFLFGSSDLILYVEVLNVFDRENVWNYYWSSKLDKPVANIHFSIIPILGINYRF